jgi:hypothetical protein
VTAVCSQKWLEVKECAGTIEISKVIGRKIGVNSIFYKEEGIIKCIFTLQAIGSPHYEGREKAQGRNLTFLLFISLSYFISISFSSWWNGMQ